jgi:lipoate-protein ligase B
VPCGIKQFGVTRLWDLSPERPTVRDMADRAIDAFGRVFETTVAFADADSLRRQLAAVAGA